MRLTDLPPSARAMLAKLDADRSAADRQAEDNRRKREAAERLRDRRIAYLIARGLPKPQTELRFHADRNWRFDFAWPNKRIALEVHENEFWRHFEIATGLGRGDSPNLFTCSC